MVRQAMGFAKAVERGHGRFAELLRRGHEARLVAQGLRAEPNVAETAEVAQVPTIRDTLRPRLVTAEDGEDGLVTGVRATPGEDAIRGSDHYAVDPRAIGPRRRESDRLEPLGIGRALAERVARLMVGVPA